MNNAIILAGGTGTRAGGPLPKQFQDYRGRRMLWWSVEAFRAFDPDCRIVLVVHPDYLERWDELFGSEEKALNLRIEKTAGGRSRIESVRNGLHYLKENSEGASEAGQVVFIHDAARPEVSPELISRGCDAVRSGLGAVPAVPVTDSLRKLESGGSKAVDRSKFVAVQTPQVFILEDISQAYDSLVDESGLTDDASVAEKSGVRITLFEGDPANLKVTNPRDFR